MEFTHLEYTVAFSMFAELCNHHQYLIFKVLLF